DGHDHAARSELFDEGQRLSGLRCQGHETNASAGRVLESAKLLPVRRPDVGKGVSAARSILSGDVGPFQMECRNRGRDLAIAFTGSSQGGKTVLERSKGGRNQRRAKGAYTVAPAGFDDMVNVGRSEAFRAEGIAITAIDLKIEECRGNPGSFEVGRVRA